MKWTRAVHHLEALAQTCAEIATHPCSAFSLRVVQLWAVGDILGAVRDVETVTVALAVDLPSMTSPGRVSRPVPSTGPTLPASPRTRSLSCGDPRTPRSGIITSTGLPCCGTGQAEWSRRRWRL
jgi:hypothetical protein